MADAGGNKEAPAAEEVPETGFVWKVPDGWGDEGRKAVLAKFEGQDIHEDYLPPTNEEIEIIKNVVKGVAHIPAAKTELDDVNLLRFVRGFTLNQWKKLPIEEATQKTVEVLTRALAFYEHVGASTILERESQIPRSYEYHKYWVNGVVGTDTFGRQIYLVHPPSSKLIKLFKGTDELLLNHVVDMERLKSTKRAEERKRGLLLYKHVMILDGGETSITMDRLMFMKNALEYEGTSVDSDFYPEMLYRAWIINAPLALRALWKMAAPFLNPITRAKFVVVGNVPLDKMVEDGLTLDNLPLYLGGNAPNPPGFHYKEHVKAGKTFERSWPVKAGDVVHWDMEMKGSYYMDIKMTLGADEIAAGRVEAPKGSEEAQTFSGSHTVTADGEVKVAFTNDGRWHGRDIVYDVRINQPIAGLAPAAAEAAGGSKE